MFLRKNTNSKTGRTHLAIVQGYRDSKGQMRHKTVRTVGYLDVLEKEYDDPIAHFTKIAEQMTREYDEQTKPVEVRMSLTETMSVGTEERKNFGYAALSKLYHELRIDDFMNNRRRYTNAQFNHNIIFQLLVYYFHS